MRRRRRIHSLIPVDLCPQSTLWCDWRKMVGARVTFSEVWLCAMSSGVKGALPRTPPYSFFSSASERD